MSAAAHTVQFAPQVETRPSPRWAPLLAGLPHLFLGAMLSSDLFWRNFIPGHKTLPFLQSSKVLIIPFLIVSLFIAVYARRHNRPVWTASWDGYAIFLTTVTIALIMAALDEESYVFQLGFILLALLAILIGYVLRFRYAPKHALLMGLVLLPFGALATLDTVPIFHQAIYVLGVYLLFALLSAWVVISPGWIAAAAVAWAASLLAAAIQWLVFVTYSAAPAAPDVLRREATQVFLLHACLISAFYFAPWLLWKIRGILVRVTP